MAFEDVPAPGKPPKVTIDGKDPFLLTTAFRWPIAFGVTAPEVVLEVDPDLAAKLFRRQPSPQENHGRRPASDPAAVDAPGREHVLEIEAEDHPKVTIKRAVLVGEAPTATPFRRALIFSDVRWYWTRAHLKLAANVRQRTGDRRLVGTGPLVTQQVVDEQRFAVFSLQQGDRPFTGDDLLRRVLDVAVGPGRWRNNARSRAALVPNDVEVDDRLDVALARVLATLGGVDLYVELDGTVVVEDRILGAERTLVESRVATDLENLGKLRLVSLARSCPQRIHVLYTREAEVRVDFFESASPATIESSVDEPSAENVIEVTDAELVAGGKKHTFGMFLPVADWIAAVNAKGDRPPGAPPLDLAVLQRLPLNQSAFFVYANLLQGVEPDQVWLRRLNAAIQHYRRTFRVNPRFSARITPGTLRPVRAALLDPVTGRRQPSPVYADHCQRPTLRFLAKKTKVPLGWNVDCWPGTTVAANRAGVPGIKKTYVTTTKVADLKPAPATVRVLDDQTLVFSVDYHQDLFGEAAQILPSQVESLPRVSPEEIAAGAALATWEQGLLTETHALATILSCVPAGPNHAEQLHRVTVGVADALPKLPGPFLAQQAKHGPDLTVRVGPSLVTARFAWDDERRLEILRFFSGETGFPSSLVPVNDEELRDYAASVAATIYATLLDHYEGAQAIPLDPIMVPRGSVHTVVHTVDPLGRALTVVNADARPPTLAPEALLSTSSRRVLLREIGT